MVRQPDRQYYYVENTSRHNETAHFKQAVMQHKAQA